MKKMISWVLLLAMVLSVFAGCTGEPDPTIAPSAAPTDAVVTEDTNVADAIAYLKTIYKNEGGETPVDFQRVGNIPVGTASYEVVYTVDCDESAVKIVKGEDGLVTIDINDESEVEVPYVLTATITGTDGTTHTLSWEHVLPVSVSGLSHEEIVDAAYALADGEELGYEATLTGVITSIDTPYSPDYKNITVTIQVAGREDKPIQCYRLKGEGADALVVGDTITVTGAMKNYKGTIEFDAGGNLDAVEKTGEVVEVPTDPAEIVAAAFALEPGQSLPYNATLTGVITAFDGGYSEKYGNVTVTIKVEGKSIVCFRMKGEGANSLHINDTITVTGVIKNYHGTIEFDAGCTLDNVVDGVPPTGPKDPLKHIDAAYKLDSGWALTYPSKLTGIVTSVDSAYSETYNNITVTIEVPGREGMPIQCFRLKGENAENIGVGDTITVRGWLMNYKGTIEFCQGCSLSEWIDAPEPVAPTDPAEIVDAAYALAEGEALPYDATLTGVITKVNTAYSEQYKNVTVTIVVAGKTDKPIECFRLKGEGADVIKEGDIITVTGILKNYYGKIEFDSGCKLVAYSEPEKPKDLATALEEAAALANGEYLGYTTTITGTVSKINTAYSEQYKNITFTVDVDGTSVYCYRIKGEGMDTLAVGDTVTVSGNLTAYKGNPQFDSKASVTVAAAEEEPLTGLAADLDAASKLANGDYLENTTTITGTVSKINTAYSEQYKNITFTVDVDGTSVYCFRIKGEGMDTLAVGDTVTVTGNLTAYNGSAQFDSKAGVTVVSKAVTETYASFAEMIEAASKLENGKYLTTPTTQIGTVAEINTAYSEQYKNITFTLDVNGTLIKCFRIKGEGMDTLAVGDTVTISGNLTAYNGSAQFDSTASVTVG